MDYQRSQEHQPRSLDSVSSFTGNVFNKRLDASQLDLRDEDRSCCARVTRTITSIVSRIIRPRQVIVLLRVLKALTFCTLCLTIISELMFVFYVEISLSRDVNIKLGGIRDRIVRVYGIGIAFLAVLVELDMNMIKNHFAGLKPFLVRSCMLLFIAAVSDNSPMIGYERRQARKNYNAYNDDDDANDKYSYNSYQSHNIRDEVPASAVAFQAITSFFLFCCAMAYFLLGALCLDRFTARAFLTDDDQVAAAVSATALRDTPRQGSYDSYDANNQRDKYANNGTYTPNRTYEYDQDMGGKYDME